MTREPFRRGRYYNILALCFLVIIGTALLYPYRNFQTSLTLDDHGNSLYAFQKTLEGSRPYRDYWWPYGPLMPYYFSFFLGLLGQSIHSVLIGYRVLYFLCGAVFYFILKRFFAPHLALTATAFFWVFNVQLSYTYNHTGGVLAILLVIYQVVSYIKTRKNHYLYVCLGCIFIASLIKINFGPVMLGGFMVALYSINKICGHPAPGHQKHIYFLAIGGIPLLICCTYWFFVQGLPFYAMRQSFLFFDLNPLPGSIWNLVQYPIAHYTRRLYRYHLWWAYVLFLFSAAYILFLRHRKRIPEKLAKEHKAVLITLAVMAFFCLHEYWATGINFKMLWAEPLGFLFVFFIIFLAMTHCPKAIQIVLCILFFGASAQAHIAALYRWQSEKQYINLPRGKIYVANGNSEVEIMTRVTEFLTSNLAPGETFLSVPNMQLYYFLANKNSPVALTEFTVPIPHEQEADIIRKLKTKEIKFVILSNQVYHLKIGRDMPGESPCVLLKNYIESHYRPYAVFGEWVKKEQWTNHDGIMILKRVD